jgi:hypothetical protein
MMGVPQRDLVGLKLPPFVTRERAVAWTEHPSQNIELVAARRWPGPKERWVVVVGGRSEGEMGQALDVRLAVVEVTRKSQEEPSVRRLARTMGPLSPRAQFSLLPRDYWPSVCDEACDDGGFGPLLAGGAAISALDFAAYDIAPGERAFGVRTTRSEGYAGGFGSFETLSLFRIDGEVLVPILDVPIAVQKMLAGDWNKDQSRQHHYCQADLIVRMLPTAHGPSRLEFGERGGRHPLRFAWDARRGSYSCEPLAEKKSR